MARLLGARTLRLGVLGLAALGLAGCHDSTAVTSAVSPATVSATPQSAKLVSLKGTDTLQLDEQSASLAGVKTLTLGLTSGHSTLSPTGQISATDSRSAQVTARLPGRVVQALVAVGSIVHKGQLIATVDSVDLTQAIAAYQTAVAHLNLSRDQLGQQRKLAHLGALSEQPVEDATRAYQAALAAVSSDKAQIKLDQSTLANTTQLVKNGELTRKPVSDAQNAYASAVSTQSAAKAAVASDIAQLALDRSTLENTKHLVQMGEVTRKPLEDAQSAEAQAQSGLDQAKTTLQSAKASLDRTKILYDGGIYSRQQMEDAQTAYDNAVSSVTQNEALEKASAQELARQKSIYDQNLNGTTALQPVQAKLEQDQHTAQNDRVTLATASQGVLQARQELGRQRNIFQQKINESGALQPAQAKLQQDQHTYQNDLVTLETSRKELSRASSVRGSGIPVSQAVQSAQDAYEEAQVAVDSAAGTLKLYGVAPSARTGPVLLPVVAPLSGMVVSRNMVVGQLTDNATPLVKIEDLSQVYVDAQVFEKDVAGVHVGDNMQLQVSAYPGQNFTGQVQYIGNEVSADTRTITVRTLLDNPGWQLRPGMFATVHIAGEASDFKLRIPSGAILQDGGSQMAYVQVAPLQFQKRKIKAVPADDGMDSLQSGLQPGDHVVVSGGELLLGEQEKLEQSKGGA